MRLIVLASAVLASLIEGAQAVRAGAPAPAEGTPANALTADTVIPAASLREDAAVLKKALTQLHPGLLRYNDSASLERRFAALEAELATDRTLRDAYLALSRLTGALRCGHTFASFWNQPKDVKAALFDLLARLLKQEGLATLAGQETGGSLRGTNGGWIAFLRLPRSRIEVDVPLKGYFPMEAQPDGGLTPDVVVPVSVEDVVRGIDPELEAARRLIAGGTHP